MKFYGSILYDPRGLVTIKGAQVSVIKLRATPRFKHFTTLLTTFFGNHLFAKYRVLKHPLTNLILSSFNIPRVCGTFYDFLNAQG